MIVDSLIKTLFVSAILLLNTIVISPAWGTQDPLPSQNMAGTEGSPGKSILQKAGLSSRTETGLSVIGILSFSCPCSRESLSAFQTLFDNLPSGSQMKVFDVGLKDPGKINKMKKISGVKFDLQSDSKRDLTRALNTQVTPSVYIFKGDRLVYSSAIIDPGQDPSPNFAMEALAQLKVNSSPVVRPAFGCRLMDEKE